MVGPSGAIIGMDMTDAQRAKAEALRRRHGVRNITFVNGYIDAAPFEHGSFGDQQRRKLGIVHVERRTVR